MREPRLDGLRAIAVLAVIASHTTSHQSGWIGVDLFFVLSGYLITGILRRERGYSQYWSRFYIKRVARILPALVLALLANAILFPREWSQVWGYCVFFLGNVAFAFHSPGISIGVLWSLAVEEHYYLLWPFAVRRMNRRHLMLLLAGTLCVEPVLRALASHHFHSPNPIYALTPFRLDGIAAGSLLALLMESPARESVRRWSGWVAVLSIASGVGMVLAFPQFRQWLNSELFNSLGYSIVDLACAGAVAFTLTHEESFSSKLLSWAPVAWIGKISYGMYLSHTFFVPFVVARLHSYQAFAADAALTIAISAVSFYGYEKPIMVQAADLLADRLKLSNDSQPRNA